LNKKNKGNDSIEFNRDSKARVGTRIAKLLNLRSIEVR